jgi:outer membrane protein TolC
MKGDNRLILLILFLSGFCFSLNAQDTNPSQKLSFEQALEITRQNSHILKQVSYLQQEKDQEAEAAKGLYSPKVGIAANYLVMSDNIHLDLTPVRDAITPLYNALGNFGNFSGVPIIDPSTHQITGVYNDATSTAVVRQGLKDGLTQIQKSEWDQMIQKKQFGTLMATMQWPLYAGGRIRVANNVAGIQQKEVGEVNRQKEGELVSELAERYFGYTLARQAVLVRQDVYDGMNRHLQDATKMEKQGLISNADVLHVRVSFSSAERELSKAKRTADILNQALTNTLAVSDSIKIETLSELFYLDSIEPSAYFKILAQQNNPLLRQVESKKLLAEQNYKAERGNFMPEIALEGMYDVVDKDLSPYAPTWMVGVGMKWTLFDGTSRYRKVKAASFKSDQVKEFEQKANSDIETMIEKLCQELTMYREQLTQLESALTFSEEYLRVREKAFHEEMSNTTDVVDARLALAQVRIERLQAMYGYDLTLARILEYAGTSDEFLNYQKRPGVKMENYISNN